jgi:hypothetical protein
LILEIFLVLRRLYLWRKERKGGRKEGRKEGRRFLV